MNRSLPNDDRSVPVRSLDQIRPRPARVATTSDRVGLGQDRVGPSLGDIVWRAIEQHYGSVKAAAIALTPKDQRDRGEWLDASLMRREILDNKFARFDAQADDEAKSAVAGALREAFPPNDPDAQLRRAVRRVRQALEAVELIAEAAHERAR